MTPSPRPLAAHELDAVSGGCFIPFGPFLPWFPQPTVCPPPPSVDVELAY